MSGIINATLKDLEPLATMFDLYRQFYRQLPDREGARRFLAARISGKESVIFLSRQTNEFTGFVQCYPLFSSVGMQRLWLLNDLFVKENFRGQGISKLLISRCKQLANDTGAKGLMLETEKTNEAGNRLYTQQGFVLNETSNFYFWMK
jgi:GNAT superfamily N-acetyltransferase